MSDSSLQTAKTQRAALSSEDAIPRRAAALFEEYQQAIYVQTDRLFAGLLLFPDPLLAVLVQALHVPGQLPVPLQLGQQHIQ